MAGEEFLINMWVEFKTDSVSKRVVIISEIEDTLGVPKGEHFKVDGDNGADIYFNDEEYFPASVVDILMQKFIESGDVLAYEYNVDEIEYTNIEHRYVGG